MPKAYFQFKQFCIQQDHAAMKVCTDGCVLGAYTDTSGRQHILDIGTGTGLLALMVAQRNKQAQIDAVEIDQHAYQQAVGNVKASPWKDRIRVIHQRIQDFTPAHDGLYDLILSNPPFYHNHLKRPGLSQNVALHTEALSFTELAQSVQRLLHVNGRFVVLLPPYQSTQLEKLVASFKLNPIDQLLIYDYVGGKQIRRLTTYAYQAVQGTEKVFYIKDGKAKYTDEFVQLLQPYYLHL